MHPKIRLSKRLMVIIGGKRSTYQYRTTVDDDCAKTMEIYSFRKRKFIKCNAKLNHRRIQSGCTNIDEHIIVVGGGIESTVTQVGNTIEMFDANKETWRLLPAMTRYNHECYPLLWTDTYNENPNIIYMGGSNKVKNNGMGLNAEFIEFVDARDNSSK